MTSNAVFWKPLGCALKKSLNTQEAYSILDFGPSRGSTWIAGGCAILAHALYMIDEFHAGAGAEIVVLKEKIDFEPDHVLLRVDRNVYMDGDGSSTWRTLRKRWIKEEGMFDPEISDYDPALLDEIGIPLDPHTSKELAKYLRRKLFI